MDNKQMSYLIGEIEKITKEIENERKIGYKGCRNCMHQIDVLRTCKWMEQGGDGVVHLICPGWERRD